MLCWYRVSQCLKASSHLSSSSLATRQCECHGRCQSSRTDQSPPTSSMSMASSWILTPPGRRPMLSTGFSRIPSTLFRSLFLCLSVCLSVFISLFLPVSSLLKSWMLHICVVEIKLADKSRYKSFRLYLSHREDHRPALSIHIHIFV